MPMLRIGQPHPVTAASIAQHDLALPQTKTCGRASGDESFSRA